MKTLLYIFGTIAFIGPVLFYGWMVEMGCGYSTNNSSCGISLDDFIDWQFFNIAILPWSIAAMCFISGYRRRHQTKG